MTSFHIQPYTDPTIKTNKVASSRGALSLKVFGTRNSSRFNEKVMRYRDLCSDETFRENTPRQFTCFLKDRGIDNKRGAKRFISNLQLSMVLILQW